MDVDAGHAPAAGPASAGSAPRRGWRARVRRTPGGAALLKAAVFLLGLLFILVGLLLAALPGPLTIPPILLGVWIWSSEFAWAERLFERARGAARDAWAQARRRPVVSALTTLAGLVALGVGLWVAGRFDLVERAREAVGL